MSYYLIYNPALGNARDGQGNITRATQVETDTKAN